MDPNIIGKVLHLKEGDQIKMNGTLFRIQKKSFHPGDKYHQDIITYDLENNFVLELDGNRPTLFQIIIKKHWLGFTSAQSKVEKIESIEIMN